MKGLSKREADILAGMEPEVWYSVTQLKTSINAASRLRRRGLIQRNIRMNESGKYTRNPSDYVEYRITTKGLEALQENSSCR